MVVRLGQTDVEVVNSQRYRLKQGMALQLSSVSDASVTVRAWARVRYDNGEDDILFIPDQSIASDRAVALATGSDVARFDGWVTDALVELPLDADQVKRGQCYVRLYLAPFGPQLCADYVSSDFGQVALGTYVPAGPAGGAGNLELVTVKADGAPAASTTANLAVSNEIRKIYGYAWYYACSVDVATRNIDVAYRDPLGDVATGMTIMDVWVPSRLVLTASQLGGTFADQKSSVQNDNGTLTVADITTAPTPFPILVEEGDNADLVFLVANSSVNDFDAIYLLRESWVIEL